MVIQLHSLEDEAGRLAALDRLDARTFTSEASFDEITGLVRLILGIEMVTISLITADKQILKARQGIDLKETARETAFCNITIRSHETLIIEDTLLDARVRENPVVVGAPFLRCYIGAPLTTAEGYNLGTICAFGPRPRQFTAREAEIMRKMAGLVMNQMELRSRANRDALTGLYNRRSFQAGLNRELAQLARRAGTAVVAFLDIDHFKRVNDTYGHPAGDRVLQEFADIVMSHCRRNDLVARLGGEEFAVLLTDADLEAGRVWAERMRGDVAATRFDGPNRLPLTVSVGLVEIAETLTTPDAITSIADKALYEAKRTGRNRVVAA